MGLLRSQYSGWKSRSDKMLENLLLINSDLLLIPMMLMDEILHRPTS